METKPKIQLSGLDGNAFGLIAATGQAITRFNSKQTDPSNMIDKNIFQKEAMAGDYDHVIQTIMKYCDVS